VSYGVRANSAPNKSSSAPVNLSKLDLGGSGSVTFDREPKLRQATAGTASSKLTLTAQYGNGPKAFVTLIPLVATGNAVYTGSGGARRVTVTYKVVTGGNDVRCRAGKTMTVLFIEQDDNRAAQITGCLGKMVLSSREDKSVKVVVGTPKRHAN
jgi:hypothetical protein